MTYWPLLVGEAATNVQTQAQLATRSRQTDRGDAMPALAKCRPTRSGWHAHTRTSTQPRRGSAWTTTQRSQSRSISARSSVSTWHRTGKPQRVWASTRAPNRKSRSQGTRFRGLRGSPHCASCGRSRMTASLTGQHAQGGRRVELLRLGNRRHQQPRPQPHQQPLRRARRRVLGISRRPLRGPNAGSEAKALRRCNPDRPVAE